MSQNKPNLANYYVTTSSVSADPNALSILYINPTVKTDNALAGNLFQLAKKTQTLVVPVFFINSTSTPPSTPPSTLLSVFPSKIKMLSDVTSTNLKQYSSYLVKLFPCVNPSVFNDDTSIINFMQNTDFIKSLQPPQPCKSDNSVYCCPNVTGPKFFNTKTVIMMLLILGLVVAMGVMLVERNKK